MFLADENVVFSIALCLLLLIAAAQLLGVGDLIGDGDVDLDSGDLDAGGIGADGDFGMVDGLVTYIGIGRMPFLMWLALRTEAEKLRAEASRVRFEVEAAGQITLDRLRALNADALITLEAANSTAIIGWRRRCRCKPSWRC